MNKFAAITLSLLGFAASPLVEAMDKRYVATPNQSQWQMVVNTPLECRLVHPIPHYGDAEFSSRASKKINLDFELKMRRPMGETRNVSLVSMPPVWRPGDGAERITTMKFFQQFDGYVGGQTAWGILGELEKGRYPTFSYQDWQSEISESKLHFLRCYLDKSTQYLATVSVTYYRTASKISHLRSCITIELACS